MRPNVLIVFVDELRKDAIGVYGNKQVITPNLNELAKSSTVYHNHFCAYPVCTPSRCSMLSGLYANEHSVWTNKGTLANGIPTFAKIMRENGYRNVAIGKMHASPTYLDVGFDKMILSEQDGDGRYEDDYHLDLFKNDLVDSIDLIDQRTEFRTHAKESYFKSFGTECTNLPEEYHSTSWITRNALKEISNWEEDGNLLFVSYIKPHHPFDPIKRIADMYNLEDIELLVGYTKTVPAFDYAYDRGYFDNATLTKDVLRKMTMYYYANITHIDEGIGQIIIALKERKLFDDTLIIFTSDHGDYLGFHHMALKQNHMYDPLMAIPLIIKRIGQNDCKIETSLSDNTQLSSEILRHINLQALGNMNTIPLNAKRKYLYGMYRNNNGASYVVRSDRYKLLIIEHYNQMVLYDLLSDPLELNDISKNEENRSIIFDMYSYLIEQLCFKRNGLNFYAPEAKIISKDRKEISSQRKMLREYFEIKLHL